MIEVIVVDDGVVESSCERDGELGVGAERDEKMSDKEVWLDCGVASAANTVLHGQC